MKKTIRLDKKLSLERTTVRLLTRDVLPGIVGGNKLSEATSWVGCSLDANVCGSTGPTGECDDRQ